MSSITGKAILGVGLLVMYDRGYLPTMIKIGSVSVFLLLLFIVTRQDDLLYIPQIDSRVPRNNRFNPERYRLPSEWDMPHQDLPIVTPDGTTIHSWLILHRQESKRKMVPTIIYFHGNAGNIGTRLPILYQLWQSIECNILAVDYRGYGDSEGKPSEDGLKEDAVAALNAMKAHPDIDTENVIVFGRSLGGAVAISLAHQDPSAVKGLIVENTFTEITDIALVLMPYLKVFKPILKAPLLKNVWPSQHIIGEIPCPILFISGAKDSLIPPAHMHKLKEVAADGKCQKVTFQSIKNGEHNTTPIEGGEIYYGCIAAFLKEIERGSFEEISSQVSSS